MAYGFSTKTANGISSPDWINEDFQTGVDTTFADDIEITLKAGYYGMANNFIQIGNYFGSDAEEYNKYDEMGELGDAYLSAKTGYDIAGEVVGSFVPGGVGLKAVKLSKLGKLGTTASKITGFSQKLVATNKELEIAYGAVSTAADITKLKRKAFGYSFLENAIDGAIVTAFVDSSLHLGDILNDEGLNTLEKAWKFGSNVAVWSIVPAVPFTPFTYLSATKGSRDVLTSITKAKQTHTFKPYAASSLHEINVTPGSSISHTMDQMEQIKARPNITGTEAEEAYRSEVMATARLALKEDVKLAVVGKRAVTKQDKPFITQLTDLAYSKLGTPDADDIKQLFERGKKFELGGVPTYSPRVTKLLKENKDKLRFTEAPTSNRRFFKTDKNVLVANTSSSYLKDYDKAVLHYMDEGYEQTRASVAKEVEDLVRNGDVGYGLDSFTAIQESFKIYKTDLMIKESKDIIKDKTHVPFAKTYPELGKLFSGKSADYIYGTDRIKYADLKQGKVVELPTAHIGDYNPSVQKNRIIIGKDTQLSTRKTIPVTELKKVDDPLTYQANKLHVLDTYTDKTIQKLPVDLNDLSPEQSIALEDVLLKSIEAEKKTVVVSMKEVPHANVMEAIRHSKALEADRLMKAGVSSDDVTNTLGLTDDFIIARGNKEIVEPQDYIANGRELAEPKHVKITTDVDLPSMESTSVNVSLDSARASQLSFLKEVGSHITGVDLNKKLVDVNSDLDVTPLGINRMLQDSVVLASYKSLNLATATIGHVKNVLATDNFKGVIQKEIARLGNIVLNDNKSAASYLSFQNWYDRQSAKFSYATNSKTVILRNDLRDSVEADIANGATLDDAIAGLKNGRDYYKISDGDTAEYIASIQRLNKEEIHGKQLEIEGAYGNRTTNNLDNIYLPPRNYPFVKYVRVMGNILDAHSEKVYRVVGKNAEDLDEKIKQAVLLGQKKKQDWSILTPEQLRAHDRASNVYDWAGQDLNLGTAVSSTERRGAKEDLYPAIDASELVNNTLDWFKRKNDSIYSAAIELHYADFVTELDSLVRVEKNKLIGETVGGKAKADIERTIGTYEQLHAQMLGYDKGNYSPWKQMNNVVEEYGAKFGTILNKTRIGLLGVGKEKTLQFKDIVKQSNYMNEELAKVGMSLPIDQAAKEIVKQSAVVTEQDVRDIVGGLNHIASTLMIRLDPADSLMNVLGLTTKLSTEVKYIQELAIGDPASQARIDKVFAEHFGAGTTVMNGNELSLTAVAKAMAKAPAELLSDIGQARLARWQKSGLAVDDVQLMSDMFQESKITKFDFVSTKNKKAYKAKLKDAVGTAVHIASKPHRATNNYTQYVALSFAEDLGKAVGLQDGELYQFMFKVSRNTSAISTHVTKPRLFQGAMGMATSLYQSYAFHTATQLLASAERSTYKPIVTASMLNGTFFGAQSIPGFKYINSQVGQDPETGHADLYTAAYTSMPKTAADFVMYGAGGAFLQSNLSVRGNMTPRHMTVIPTELSELPAVSALSQFIGSVYDNTLKLASGDQTPTQFILNTAIDTHINRPLAGLASIAQGKSTDSRHSLVMGHEETFSVASALRIVGLKPLKEQIVTDYYWRNQAYQLGDRSRRNNLSEVVKLRYESEPTYFENPTKVTELSDEYVKAGGQLSGFDRWMENSITKGSTDLESRLEDQLDSYLPYSQNFSVLTK